MQDAYHSKMRQIEAQNASRRAGKARARVKAAEAPTVDTMLIGLGVLSLIVAAFFSFQSF